MPEEAQDGDTEGGSRGENRESEEIEERSDVARKINNNSEVDTGYENVKGLEVRYDWVGNEEVGEEAEDDNHNEDDSDDGDSWINKTQKKRNEEEKDYVWIRAVDKETYLKVMAPQYLLLEVRSTSPLQEQHVMMAVSHLSRMWPWWSVGTRHRGQERAPWLCVAPRQRPTLQSSGADEDELWDLVNQQQWRHTHLAEGMLSSVTLITHPWLAAAAAAAAAVPHTHRNEGLIPAADNVSVADAAAAAASSATTTTTSASTSVSAAAGGDDHVNSVPDLPHTVCLMLGVPRPFVDDASAETICRTLITLLDDVLSGRIQEEYRPEQESESHGESADEAESPSLESWLVERMRVGVDVQAEVDERNADPLSERPQGEENEDDTRGYVQRTFDSITSRNFINRCKTERVSYVNGFATCVSTAAAAFLAVAEEGGRGQRVVTRQRVCEHLHWPASPMEWHDDDPDEELHPQPPSRPPGVTITAPTGKDDLEFWEAARQVSRQRWGTQAGDSKGAPLQIFQGLIGEDSEDDTPLPRYPTVSLRLCDIHRNEVSAPSVQRAGEVVGVGPYSLSPLRHFLITHTVNLHLEEGTQILTFSLHHSTLFLSPETGRSFADEIETVLKNSLKRR